MKVFAATCIIFLFSFDAGPLRAVEYYKVDNLVLEIVGKTKEEGMHDAVAAIHMGNYGVLTWHGLQASLPVYARNGKTDNFFFLEPRFSRCYRPQELPLSIGLHFMLVEDNLYSSTLEYLFDNYKPIDMPPPVDKNFSTCTWEYASGYNTVVINYLLTHPEALARFRRDDDHEREPQNSLVDEEEPFTTAPSEGMDAHPTSVEDCPPAYQETAADAGSAYDEDGIIIIIPDPDPEKTREEELRRMIRPVDPNEHSKPSCDEPWDIENGQMLPLGDLLRQQGLL